MVVNPYRRNCTMAVDIKILGSECPRCKQLAALMKEITVELQADVTLEKINDFGKIASYGILAIPGLVINGKVKSAGIVPRKNEIVNWIEEARKEQNNA